MTDFDEFWIAYPRKTAKQKARIAFDKAVKKVSIHAMFAALEWQRQTDQWLEGIIPHPATWLNQERWDDERPVSKLSGKNAKTMKAIFGDEDPEF